MSSFKIVISGGGTGGHVFPALAIAEELRTRGHKILYVGSPTGMEARLAPERNFDFIALKSGAVKNQSAMKLVQTVFQLIVSIVWAWRFLLREKPNAVLGVGGYVSFPLCLSAAMLGIPLFLQEQNATPGIANRFLGRFARWIFLGFEQAATDFSESKCVFTGNPLRREVTRENFPPHDPRANSLLIMGGSQGARAINEVVIQLLPAIEEAFPNVKVVHQTGVKDLDAVTEGYRKFAKGKHQVVPFIQDVAGAYAAASFVVCRSGALTVSELIAVRRPALFVPYPRKGQNDQTTNAYLMQDRGVARVVEQGEKFSERFWDAFRESFSTGTQTKMAASYSGLRHPGGLVTIADRMERELRTRAP